MLPERLELRPKYAEVYNNLGLALKERGEEGEAIACYRRALELMPAAAEIHDNLGLALETQGRLEEAAACHRRALELKPEYAGAYYNLGSVLVDLGDLQGAIDSLRATLRAIPALPWLTPGWRIFWADDCRRRNWSRSAACWGIRTSRIRNDWCCTSAWRTSWMRGANMPRLPNTSTAAMPCSLPSGGNTARSTSRRNRPGTSNG